MGTKFLKTVQGILPLRGLMQNISIMAERYTNRAMNIEKAVQQVMDAMEKDDNEIYRESEDSDSDRSDDVDPTYAPSTLETHYSDTEARIQPLYSTDSGSNSEEESEHPAPSDSSATSDSSSTSSNISTRTRKMELSGVHSHLLREDLDLTI
ncbi:unnamed protein product [Clavelina lepadiformis]|uniref:Uncharacterized protein n=1 Tax=Clavelina lepadiformis TaxID=159417 RepID=A0ABP0G2H5_CLALP